MAAVHGSVKIRACARAAHNRFLLKSQRALLNFVPLEARSEHTEVVEATSPAIRRAPRKPRAATFATPYNSRVLVVTDDMRAAAEQRSLHEPVLAPLGTGSSRG